MQNEGWVLLFQRGQTEIAEIDLIMQKDEQIRLIEVKTLDSEWRSFQRISKRQIQKLLLNQIYFSQFAANTNRPYEFSSWVVWVSDLKIESIQIN